jgi:hypothetical protein
MGAPVGNKNAKGNQGGRPSKCTPELLEKVRDYTDNFEKFGDVFPSMAALSLVLNIPRESLQRWRREKATPEQEEFEFLSDMILCKQEKLLLNKGLSSEWNSAIVKLLLGKHGYSEKHENTLKAPQSVSMNIHFVEPKHP